MEFLPSIPCHRLVALVLFLMVLAFSGSAAALTITEVMYHPHGDDESLEYVEIYNETKDPIDLLGFQFTRGLDFEFTDRRFLDGQQYLVVCRDEQRIRETYGIDNVIGNWNPETALANGGETIQISNRSGALEARLRYNDRGRWPIGADGTGHSLEIIDPYKDAGDPTNWAVSRVVGGSPGLPNDPATDDVPVRINEGFFWGDAGAQWVELYNDSENELDLSGYFLTIDPGNLTQAALPGAPMIAPRGHVTFTAAELGIEFVQVEGEKLFVALVGPEGDRVVDAFNFRPEVEEMSEARIPDGGRRFQDGADPTPGLANVTSASEDIVINEIFYHPFRRDFEKHPDKEFLELYNRGTEAVDLSGWRLDDGVNYTVPEGTVLAPDSYLVIARDPQLIQDVYGLGPDQVLGPADEESREEFGVLADAGERLTLVDALGRTVDTVRYYDGGDWSLWADGEGSSLELIDANQDNSFAQAWDASDDSAKAEAAEFSYVGAFNSGGEEELHLHLVGPGITLVDDIAVQASVTTFETFTTFLEFEDIWLFFKGTEEPPADWKELDFDDSEWNIGVAPVGFSRRWEGGTWLGDMEDNYRAVYFRKEIMLESLEGVATLVADVNFDDGFALYINGVEVATQNLDEGRTFDSDASGGGPARSGPVRPR